MFSFLIDYDRIVKKQSRLSAMFRPPKTKRNFYPGLVIIASNDKIRYIPTDKQRIEYIHSDTFINDIVKGCFVMYNKKRKICVIPSECGEYFDVILPALQVGLNPNTHIWISIAIEDTDFSQMTNKLVRNGFEHPYVTTMTPLYDDIKPSIAMVRKNIPNADISSTADKDILYAIKQYNNTHGSCHIYIKLTKRAIDFLKKASKMGITINKNGKKSQKELTGELYVRDVILDKHEIVHLIDINKSSVKAGEEENVSVVATRYNFHSHPHEAYVRHSVHKAWPSVTDFLGYHHLGSSTIFHCVATLEGLYIMSFSPYWGSQLDKISVKFIDKNYHIDHKEHYTPEQFIDKINNIKYKNYPIFILQYFSWERAGAVFKIYYPQTGSSCLPSEKSVEIYKYIHT